MGITEYPENVKIFLHEVAGFINQPKEANGFLIMPIRQEITDSAVVFIPLYRETILPLINRLGLNSCFKLLLRSKIEFEIDLLRANIEPRNS